MAFVAVVQTVIERKENIIKIQIMAKNNLTSEEKAARAAARQKTARKVADHSRPATDPQPTESDPNDRQDTIVPADDERGEQEEAEASQKTADVSTEKKEDAPLSHATVYADNPSVVAARTAEAKATDNESRPRPTATATDNLRDKGRQILKEYPAAMEVYMTSNGFGFFREQDARNHSATLRDKTVIIVKRK